MANLILVEGPDNAGKTTLINDVLGLNDKFVKLDFPKQTSEGRFDIKSRNEVACFETMLKHLDPTKIYLIDRGYISNYVYGSYRNEPNFEIYEKDFERLIETHRCLVILLTRDKISNDFKDNLIKLSSDDFNLIIDKFSDFAVKHKLYQGKVLSHYPDNKLYSVNADNLTTIMHKICTLLTLS